MKRLVSSILLVLALATAFTQAATASGDDDSLEWGARPFGAATLP
jgi:Ni/Co efflux regulator RcnB